MDFQNKIITLPKLKEVKFKGYRHKTNFIGNIKSAVIRRQANKYYVSLLVEEPLILPEFIPRSIVGLDLGIKDAVIYDLDSTPVSQKTWSELENMRIYYDFFKSHAQEFEKN